MEYMLLPTYDDFRLLKGVEKSVNVWRRSPRLSYFHGMEGSNKYLGKHCSRTIIEIKGEQRSFGMPHIPNGKARDKGKCFTITW